MSAAYHLPVLVDEVCEGLAPALRAAPGLPVVDCPLGGGGHAEAILGRLEAPRLLGLDRDPAAIEFASQRLAPFGDRFCATHAPFSTLAEVLADLGVGPVARELPPRTEVVLRCQLDRRERGFSFMGDAPLDMRMDTTRGPTAAEVLATIDAKALTRLLRELGEEPDADRIAKAIVATRPTTTRALAEVVENAMSARQRRQIGKRIHPATRTFQALRIHVNRELEELATFLDEAPELLSLGGRLAVITFHSLEDRAVKRRFGALSRAPEPPRGLPIPAAELPTARFSIPKGARQGWTASAAELETNPRSRSARLRVLERAA
ncbi:MAG: 16S rRNA (cytosine(1402)-N(4))-methyltransferase RsmH [Myxococcales bacterium]|nr:16S rRNA (cytosine(1402)-N(4))-methyltransferase RsmH [Myxococcales bacterium]